MAKKELLIKELVTVAKAEKELSVKELVAQAKAENPMTGLDSAQERKQAVLAWQESIKKIIASKKTLTLEEKRFLKIESLSNQIMMLNQNDLIEWEEQKAEKSFFLSNWLKEEMVLRAFNSTKGTRCTTVELPINRQASLCLLGLGFVQNDWFNFMIKPNREYNILISNVHFDNMKNGQRDYFNRTLDINIPLDANTKERQDELDMFDLEGIL